MRSRQSGGLLLAFAALMIFEGGMRKWGWSSIGLQLQILRDILPILALLLVLREPATRIALDRVEKCGLSLWLAAYVIAALLAGMISLINEPMVALLGIRTHLFYIPLIFLPTVLSQSPLAYEKWLRSLLLISLPISALAIYQTTQPPDSLINVYADGEAANAHFGEALLVRASGTFPYLTSMGIFGQLTTVAAFALLLVARDARQAAALVIALAVNIAGAVSTGARGVVTSIVVQCALILLLNINSALKDRSRLILLLAAMATLGFVMPLLAPDQFSALAERFSTSHGDESWRLDDMYLQWIDILYSQPLGAGLGAGHQKAATFLGGEAGFNGELPESELSRVALEMGIAGFFVFSSLRFWVAAVCLRTALRAVDPRSRLIASLCFVSVLGLLAGGVYTPIANALFWVSAGVSIAISTRVSRLPY